MKDKELRDNCFLLSHGQRKVGFFAAHSRPIQAQLVDETTKRQFEPLIPRGQLGRPEEVATMALFLASDDPSYVNGVELAVDGGPTNS